MSFGWRLCCGIQNGFGIDETEGKTNSRQQFVRKPSICDKFWVLRSVHRRRVHENSIFIWAVTGRYSKTGARLQHQEQG